MQNLLLARLPPADLDLLSVHMRVVRLSVALAPQHRTDSQAYFPHGGAVSSGVVVSDGRFIPSAVVGRDGVVGGPAALHDRPDWGRFEVHVDAMASAIGHEVLREATARSPAIRSMLLQHQNFLLFQAQWIAACNACHNLEQRFSSCLVRFENVCGQTILPLKQEIIAQILGVQRTSVNVIARRMQQGGIIRIRRGNIQVLNQEALEEAACDCARNIRLQYRTLFGALPTLDHPDAVLA